MWYNGLSKSIENKVLELQIHIEHTKGNRNLHHQKPISHREDKMNDLDIADCINETCPWSGDPVQADSLTVYNGHVVGFCNPGCRDKFDAAVRYCEAARGDG